MTAMVSTVLRCSRGFRHPAACCALLTVAAILCGCTRAINGTVHAVAPDGGPAEPIAVADLLIEPGRFPAQYPAAVLDPNEAYRVLHEIDGVAAGSVVAPPECAPPPVVAPHSAAVQGIDHLNAGRLIVTVTRPAPSLRARVDQLAGCESFTSSLGDDVSTVTVSLPPAPPVDADDSYAVDQTVTSASESSESSETRMLTLVARIADVQVSAGWLLDGASETASETQALDTLFADAVLKVRRLVPR
ncbi:MAG: hypothetical protein ACRDU5_03000 [Mycobacterium sp.]